MTTELDTLLTALYVHVDDHLKTPRWRGRPPRLTEAQMRHLQALTADRAVVRTIRVGRDGKARLALPMRDHDVVMFEIARD